MMLKVSTRSFIVAVAIMTGAVAFGGASVRHASAASGMTIGYLVKTLSNPYFVAMGDAAKAAGAKYGATVVVEAGKYDGDNSSEISQVDDFVTRQAKAIALVPNLSSGLDTALRRAKAAGIAIIAVDTALAPTSLATSFVATDNLKAGVLNGRWAKAKFGSTKPVIALLEGTPGSSVNSDRMNGFLQGYGPNTKQYVVADQIANGDQGKGQTAMENILTAHPDVNLVWTINEPVALGAATAIKAHGMADKITIVSMDGSCRGIKGVRDGAIATDVMQFPKKMATEAVQLAQQAGDGKKIPARVDTGETLVTAHTEAGVPSQSVEYGLKNCW